jgi:hypothetical protein
MLIRSRRILVRAAQAGIVAVVAVSSFTVGAHSTTGSPAAHEAANAVHLAADPTPGDPIPGDPTPGDPTPSEPMVETFQGTEVPLDAVEDAVEPIDASDSDEFEFAGNVDLSDAEVADRIIGFDDKYELGEPLSLKDLEFVRAYAEIAPPSELPADTAGTEGATVQTAAYRPASSLAQPAGFDNWTGNGSQSFKGSKKSQGVTAALSGKFTRKISGLDNNWSISVTNKITAGRSNVKNNKVYAVYHGYGAVAKWPYIGLIYSKTVSVSNGTRDVSMSQGYHFAGLSPAWDFTAYGSVTTKSGSFTVTF